jgi:CYTH domain-containing protein
MATEIELEKTYVARSLPEGILSARSEIISDFYINTTEDIIHPVMRLRRRGNRYELTKKQPIEGTDSSAQTEHTIPLSEAEYLVLKNNVPGRYSSKRRYYMEIEGASAEVDIYEGELTGLVVIDFEFSSKTALQNFSMPKVCLADVTQDIFMAGGMLAGKTYDDLRLVLDKYGYKPLKVGA